VENDDVVRVEGRLSAREGLTLVLDLDDVETLVTESVGWQ